MKILIISPKFHPIIGGGETFVLDSLEQLHRAGTEIAIAVEPHSGRVLSNYPYAVYEVPGLSDTHLDIIKATDGLYKLWQEYKPDLLHVHGYFGLLAARLAMKDTPIVASIHSTPVWGERIIGGMSNFEAERTFAEQVLRLTMPRIVTGANDVYTDAARKLVPDGVPVRKFPYPIQDVFYRQHERTTYRRRFGLSDGDILVTVPSRIIERKGIKEAVEAISLLPRQYYLCLPSAVKPLDENYWLAITRSDAYTSSRDRIIVPPSEILHDQMPLLYAASDIVAMPSYYEGAPVATVEAMAMRRPFVGADSQGINGFIRDHENGLLVPQKTVKELAAAIAELSTDSELKKHFTDQAADEVTSLSWRHQLPELLKLYQEAVR